MASLIPKKPSSSMHSPSSFFEDERAPVAASPVTSCLYLKPRDGTAAAAETPRPALDREVVLRRIRHRKRVNRIRSALHSLVQASPGSGERGDALETDVWWLDDAFSAP